MEILNNYLLNDLSKIIIEYTEPRLKDICCDRCHVGNILQPPQIDIYNDENNIDTEHYDLMCNSCSAYYLMCRTCTPVDMYEYTDLGYDSDNADRKLDPDLYPVELCQFLGGQLDGYNDEDYSVEERNIRYAHASDLQKEFKDFSTYGNLTGNNGGNFTYWKCLKCEETYSVTDK